MKKNAWFIFKMAITVALIFILPTYINAAPNYTLKDLGNQYQVDWVGNSFPATKIFSNNNRRHVQQEIEDIFVKPDSAIYSSTSTVWNDRRHVQQEIEDIFVKPDGTVYSNAVWDERVAQASVYKDGNQIAIMDKMLGFGVTGGYAVTAKGNDLYVAIKVRNIDRFKLNKYGNPVYPQKNEVWYGFRAYDAKTDKLASFINGYGENASFILVNKNKGDIHGLAINGQRLYVSDTFNNQIKVYDLENLTQQPILTWSVEQPGKLAFDQEGQLWVVQYQTNRILRFSPGGKILSQQIALPKQAIASDIAIDPQGNLLVTDIGKEQNIKIYEQITTEPRLKRTFGESGGIFAEPQGKFTSQKFYNPKGIGTDEQGNIYIAQDAWSSVGGGGTIIASYQPNGDLRWQIYSLEFMSGLDIDSQNEKLLYSKERIYRFDKTQKPGKTSTYYGTTLNPYLFPDDPRIHEHFTGVELRKFKQNNLLFTFQRNGRNMAIFRFDHDKYGETAIPYAIFSGRERNQKRWNVNQPQNVESIWLDNNLDGQLDLNEFSVNNQSIDQNKKIATDWFVDRDSNIWTVTQTEIRKFPLVKFQNDYPVWDFDNVENFKLPSSFIEARRIFYDPLSDSMYLAGYTADAPYSGEWKAMGKKLARFDNWSSSPSLKWVIDTPWYYDNRSSREKPITLDIEGDYVFVGLESTGKKPDWYQQSTVFVYDKMKGKYIGSMQHKNKVGPIMLDKATGLNVRKTKDGEYLILLQDAAYARSIIFHWQPDK